jgi:hypothetical protein
VSGPPPLPADFVLENINGRPVPTYLTPIPESPTIISSTLSLDGVGNAAMTEHFRQMGSDVTYTVTYTYKITDNEIEFDYSPPCPPNALCVEPPRGTISDDRLSLKIAGPNSAITYNYVLTSS